MPVLSMWQARLIPMERSIWGIRGIQKIITGLDPMGSRNLRTSIFCATDPGIGSTSGLYWEYCAPKEVFKSARDPDLGSQLWELSNKMCGIEDFFHLKKD